MQPGCSDSRSHPLHHSHRSPGHDEGRKRGPWQGCPGALRSEAPPCEALAQLMCIQRLPAPHRGPLSVSWGCGVGPAPAARACCGMEVTAAKAHTGWVCGQTRLSWPRATSSLLCCRLVKSNTPVCLPRNPWQAGEAGLWASHTGTGGTW